MTPELVKKKFQSFKKAEGKYKRAKVNLKKAYSEMLYQFAKTKDIKGFNDCARDGVADLGEEFNFSVISIKELFNLKD